MARLLTVLVFLLFMGAIQAESLPTQKVLTLDVAKKMIAAAEATSVKNKFTMTICVVDGGNHMIAYHRMDDASLVSADLATLKAISAVSYKQPTKEISEALAKGNTVPLKIQAAMPIEGGIPIIVDGKVIGAIGVSGGKPNEDGIVAQAGLDAVKDYLK